MNYLYSYNKLCHKKDLLLKEIFMTSDALILNVLHLWRAAMTGQDILWSTQAKIRFRQAQGKQTFCTKTNSDRVFL